MKVLLVILIFSLILTGQQSIVPSQVSTIFIPKGNGKSLHIIGLFKVQDGNVTCYIASDGKEWDLSCVR